MESKALAVRPRRDEPLFGPAPANLCRLTVLETVYHSSPHDQPSASERTFVRHLATDEQPYLRRLTATEEWKPLDTGWLERAGMAVLTNEEGRFTLVPTDLERADAAARVLELAVSVNGMLAPFALVLPGESVRFQPADVKRLLVRCRRGTARYTAHLFPA